MYYVLRTRRAFRVDLWSLLFIFRALELCCCFYSPRDNKDWFPHYKHTQTQKCVIAHHKLKSSTVNLWQKGEKYGVPFHLFLFTPVVFCMNYVGVLFVVCRCKCMCVGLRTSLISQQIAVGRPAGFLSDNGNASPHTHTLIFYIHTHNPSRCISQI